MFIRILVAAIASIGLIACGDDGAGSPTMNADASVAPNPNGYESSLDIVLAGATVPGDVPLGLASSPETPRNPGGSEDERRCFDLANAARREAGLEPFLWDGDLADLGRSHADDMQQLDYFGHGSSTTEDHLYGDRGDFLGLDVKFSSVVENSAFGYPTPEALIEGWLGSPGHRAVILGEDYWSAFTYAGCGKSATGNYWNLEFGRPL